MMRTLVLLFLAGVAQIAFAIDPPAGLVSRAGSNSIVLHWDKNTEANLAGYHVYRSITNGPFILLNSNLASALVTSPGYCDLDNKVINGQTNL